MGLDCENILNGARGRNRTGTPLRARDFKSLVSTNFTTRAGGATLKAAQLLVLCGAYFNLNHAFKQKNMLLSKPCKKRPSYLARSFKFGGANQSRTGLNGFAGRGITALLSRRELSTDD